MSGCACPAVCRRDCACQPGNAPVITSYSIHYTKLYDSIDWLKNAVNRLSDDSAGVVGCHCEPPLNASWVEQAWHVSKPSGLKKVRFLGTANFIVSRDTFDLVGGFNTDLRVGEDYEFCFKVSKIGLNIVSDDSISVIV